MAERDIHIFRSHRSCNYIDYAEFDGLFVVIPLEHDASRNCSSRLYITHQILLTQSLDHLPMRYTVLSKFYTNKDRKVAIDIPYTDLILRLLIIIYLNHGRTVVLHREMARELMSPLIGIGSYSLKALKDSSTPANGDTGESIFWYYW